MDPDKIYGVIGSMLILDATAGYRLMWQNKDPRWTIFIDKRRECKPDIVADTRFIPIREKIVDIGIWDPPHLIMAKKPSHREQWRNHPSFKGRTFNEKHKIWTMPEIIYEKFSVFPTRTHLINYLYQMNREWAYILKATGSIHMKIINGEQTINLKMIRELLTNFKVTRILRNTASTFLVRNKPIWLTLKLRQDLPQASPTL